jgi:hypothetical protein
MESKLKSSSRKTKTSSQKSTGRAKRAKATTSMPDVPAQAEPLLASSRNARERLLKVLDELMP